MAVQLPSPDQLREVARQCGLSLAEADVASFRALMAGSVAAYNLIDAMPDEVPPVQYPRTPGYRPGAAENPRNAWYRKTSIKGAAGGKLKGKRIAIKDNIMVAGVPMMNGASEAARRRQKDDDADPDPDAASHAKAAPGGCTTGSRGA